MCFLLRLWKVIGVFCDAILGLVVLFWDCACCSGADFSCAVFALNANRWAFTFSLFLCDLSMVSGTNKSTFPRAKKPSSPIYLPSTSPNPTHSVVGPMSGATDSGIKGGDVVEADCSTDPLGVDNVPVVEEEVNGETHRAHRSPSSYLHSTVHKHT